MKRALIAVLVAFAGCNPYAENVVPDAPDASVEEDTPPAVKTIDGIDASDDDASAAPSAADASDDGPIAPDGGALIDGGIATNLVTNGDFESGSCVGWTKNSLTCNVTAVARSGTYSARLCSATGGVSFFESIPIGGLPVGTTFDFLVWLHATDAGATTGGASCKLEVFDKTDSISLGGPAEEPIGMPSSTWQPCMVSITLTAAQVASGNKLRPVVIEGASGCMLVDDAALTKR